MRPIEIHPRLSINTLCFEQTPLDILIAKVAELGARAISPDVSQVLMLGPAATGTALQGASLDVATLTHRAFSFADRAQATQGREQLERTVELAAQIGARSITMTTGGRGELPWGEAVARFAEAVAPCAELARKRGIALAIEPTSHLYADASVAHRLTDCTTIARLAGINIAADLFACWFDSDIDAAIREAGSRIALVQVSDYVPGDRTLPCRAVPGDGAIPLARLISQILMAGYDGYFDLEVIGPRLLSEGTGPGLRRACDYMGKLLDAGPTALVSK